MRLPEWKLGSNNACHTGNWVLISRNTRWRSKVNSLFSYRSESFPSRTFPFSLKKVLLGFQQFNKAQMSHRHTTNAPPTHLICYKIKQRPTRRSTVDQQSADSRPTVDRRVGQHVGRRVGGIGFLTFTNTCASAVQCITSFYNVWPSPVFVNKVQPCHSSYVNIT